MDGCADAVRAFAAPTAALPALIDLVGSGADAADDVAHAAADDDAHVRAHAAALLAACIADDDDGGGRRALVVRMIKGRVGLAAYSDVWARLRASAPFAAAARGQSEWRSRWAEALLSGRCARNGVVLYAPWVAQLFEATEARATEAIWEAHTVPDDSEHGGGGVAAPPTPRRRDRADGGGVADDAEDGGGGGGGVDELDDAGGRRGRP